MKTAHMAQKVQGREGTLPKVCHLAASNTSMTLQIDATRNLPQVAGSQGEEAKETGRCN